MFHEKGVYFVYFERFPIASYLFSVPRSAFNPLAPESGFRRFSDDEFFLSRT